MDSSDLLNFDELSRELTGTEAGIRFLTGQIGEHRSQTGHNPLAEPVVTVAVSVRRRAVPRDREPLIVEPAARDTLRASDGLPAGLSPSPIERPAGDPAAPEFGFCEEKHQLIDEFLRAVRELNALQEQQTQTILDGDSDFTRFDVLLHLAQQKKENAKYAWMLHVESHHCEEA
jgi:hypothetical protein